MKELILRLKGATPRFFRKVQVIGAALGTAALAAPPEWDVLIGGVSLKSMCAGAGFIAALIAQLTVKDYSQIEKAKHHGTSDT